MVGPRGEAPRGVSLDNNENAGGRMRRRGIGYFAFS
jgi:hypothetical protein